MERMFIVVSITQRVIQWQYYLLITPRQTFYNYVEEIQQDAALCRYLFTAKLLYMFRASIATIIRCT